jgi:hypothetical protein
LGVLWVQKKSLRDTALYNVLTSITPPSSSHLFSKNQDIIALRQDSQGINLQQATDEEQ